MLGDSLSDEGIKYLEKIACCIPFRLFLDKSPYDEFTNGFVWSIAFINRLKFENRKKNKGMKNANLLPIGGKFVFFKNKAEGGATSYNYRSFWNMFKYFKGFFMSLFLGNIQKQAKHLQSEDGFKSDDLTICFAGANDLITVAYPNKAGAERAVQGIVDMLKIVTKGKNPTELGCKNILLVSLPDISKMPKFLKKAVKERREISEACQVFNDEINALKEQYRYVDFSFCDIYVVKDRSEIKPETICKNAIVFAGTGSIRKIYFIENKKFIEKDGKLLFIDKEISKQQQKLLALPVKLKGSSEINEESKLKRTVDNNDTLDKLVFESAAQANLNVNIEIYPAAEMFDEIYRNPEANDLTNGCAIYYCENKDELNVEKLKENAVILMPMIGEANQYQLCLFHDKEMIICKDLKLNFSEDEKNELNKKLSKMLYPEADKRLIKLIGSEDVHYTWETSIIQRSVKCYEKVFGKKIKLADSLVTILQALKAKFPGMERGSWDGLHPSELVHFLFAIGMDQFFKYHYEIVSPRRYYDDMTIETNKTTESKLESQLPSKSYEAPEFNEMPTTRNRFRG
ncbi:MAG: SGNH/GDSL hydrolase family protein [Rickettsiella sp.]|nr:SGNH/GDSL hydrolase family protein [Rickettsiella sp.]